MGKKNGRKKGKNMNRAGNMDIDMWRARQVSKRTKEALRERGLGPANEVGTDAVPLSRRAYGAAYREEYKRQSEQFSAERRALRGEKHKRKSDEPKLNPERNRAAENAAQRRIQQHARHEANIAWWSEHQNDTDEELLNHVKRESAALRHLPKTTEVLGADYIATRFGGWRLTLFLAGVPLPDNAALPSQAEIDEARRRMEARRAEREEKSAASEEAAYTSEY